MKAKRKRKTTALPKSNRQKVIDIQNKAAGRPKPLQKLIPISPSLPIPDPEYMAQLREEIMKDMMEKNDD